MITEVHQQGRFYRLSTGRAAHFENLKPHVLSPEDWCVPQNMEGQEYLLVEPACEVNEKGTREKNDVNEDVSMDDNEKIEADSDAESFVEEDWNDPEQNEVPKWTEPDLPITAETRSGNRKWTSIRYNRYGDDFLIDKIQPDKLGEELLSGRVGSGRRMANNQRQRRFSARGLLHTRTINRSEAERDREEGKHKLENTRVDARCQEHMR